MTIGEFLLLMLVLPPAAIMSGWLGNKMRRRALKMKDF